MIKLWHISDLHLSFDSAGNVRKPMHERTWSKGSPNYVNYLQKIASAGKNDIAPTDIVCITGDITHDMRHQDAIHNINWCRNNINGTLVFIRGNHDRSISFPKLRVEYAGSRTHFLEEGEVINIGPYTFGCYSNHASKNDRISAASSDTDTKYVDTAKRIVQVAANNRKTPVMLSHYPLSEAIAQKVGKSGVKAYLSGHIHCTVEGGTDWTWYDELAKATDDNKIEGCYFSTGTTDVLLNKHGRVFKEIESVRASLVDESRFKVLRDKAAKAFSCNQKFVKKFHKVDPFNPSLVVSGFICQKKGTMQGSLYITHVNGVGVKPQLIYGTPKLAYPYSDNRTREISSDIKGRHYIFTNKWNGMNILFFKYFDANNVMYISAKSKGAPFLGDTEHGNFLSLTREVLEIKDHDMMRDIPAQLMPLLTENFQSMSFELYGKKEPHLVKYDVDIALEALFYTDYNGTIFPYVTSDGGMQYSAYYSSNDLSMCIRVQQERDHARNIVHRKMFNLPMKYEYEHFATEGAVLYAVDEWGGVKDRILYKVKPPDVEEVHWSNFDATMQTRVDEAVKKIRLLEEEISAETLQEELDMGPKEWSRFGRDILSYVQLTEDEDNAASAQLLILVGLPGSGKSTFANALTNSDNSWVRINQDELGSRKRCKVNTVAALKDGKSVVIDRVNFDDMQRKTWIDIAKSLGVKNIRCIWFQVPEDVCKGRVAQRKDHPTIHSAEEGDRVIDMMSCNMREPTLSEGFCDIVQVDSTTNNFNDILAKLRGECGDSNKS